MRIWMENWFWTLAQSEQICRSCSLLSTNIVSHLCLQFQQQSRLAWQVGLLSSQFQVVLFQQVTGLHPEELLLWFWTGLSGRIWTTWASPSPNYNCLISLGMGHAEFCKTLSVVFDQRWKHRDLGKIVGATASNSPIRFVQEHAYFEIEIYPNCSQNHTPVSFVFICLLNSKFAFLNKAGGACSWVRMCPIGQGWSTGLNMFTHLVSLDVATSPDIPGK